MSKGATKKPPSTGHEGKASAPETKPNEGKKGYAVSRYKCEEGTTYGHGTAIKTTMVQKATPLQGTHRERCRERVPAIRTVMKHGDDAEKATKPAVMHTNGRMGKGRLTAETENGTSSSLNGTFWLIVR